MNRGRFEALVAVLLAITCCAGLPLVVAAGAGAALWFGGIALGVAVLAVSAALLRVRGAADRAERERV